MNDNHHLTDQVKKDLITVEILQLEREQYLLEVRASVAIKVGNTPLAESTQKQLELVAKTLDELRRRLTELTPYTAA
jgi:hypothetical protein